MAKSKKTRGWDRPLVGSPQRSAGERSEPGRSGGDSTNGRAAGGDIETLERPKRRTFTADYKLRMLQEADAAKDSGGVGALLRREGLYSSHLTTWRRERDEGALAGLAPRRRGPKARVTAEAREIARLKNENDSLRHRLKQAETIIEFQKKLHDVLGIPLSSPPGTSETSR